jgi:hypothetical protein
MYKCFTDFYVKKVVFKLEPIIDRAKTREIPYTVTLYDSQFNVQQITLQCEVTTTIVY